MAFRLFCHAEVDVWPEVVLWLDKMAPGWTFEAELNGMPVRSRIFDPHDRAVIRSRYAGYSLCINFSTRDQMILCKLAWGGKDRSA